MNYIIVGVKGSGCAALALYLKDKGYNIIGYDVENYIYTEDNLIKNNIKIKVLEDFSYNKDDIIIIGHNFMDSIYTARLDNDNMIYYEYNYFISNLNHEKLVCISGSHGKTTLTSMLAHVVASSYIVGDGTGHYNPTSPYLFLESCEYKDHFLVYKPYMSIITNIDYDHVDYFKTRDCYIETFNKFSKLSKSVLISEEESQNISSNNLITYGYNKNKGYSVKKYNYSKEGIEGSLYFNDLKLIDFKYNHMFGKHLLDDVILTFIFAHIENLDLNSIKRKLYSYKMANKRFNQQFIKNSVIISDYGHHPTQIKSNYLTVKEMYNKDLILIFKPDRLSRIEYFKEEFNNVFRLFKYTFILDFNNKENTSLLSEFNNDNIIYLKDINMIKKYINFSNNNVFLLSSSKSLEDVKNYIISEINTK